MSPVSRAEVAGYGEGVGSGLGSGLGSETMVGVGFGEGLGEGSGEGRATTLWVNWALPMHVMSVPGCPVLHEKETGWLPALLNANDMVAVPCCPLVVRWAGYCLPSIVK